MNDTMLMVLDNAALQAEVVPRAIELKDAALAASALVGRVANAQEQELAVAAQLELDNLIRLAEKSRKAIKAPVTALGREIDSKHEEFIADVIADRTRLTRLIADFQELERARVRAAEAAARLEAEKLERERQAELRRIQEAEEAERRKLAKAEEEARALATAAKNKEDLEAAIQRQRELERQRDLAQAASLEQMASVQERFNDKSAALAAKPIPAPARADGQVVKPDWEIQITNPFDLARYHPQCVTITPKVGEIKELLKQGISVRGVVATPIIKSGTRATSGQKLIEV